MLYLTNLHVEDAIKRLLKKQYDYLTTLIKENILLLSGIISNAFNWSQSLLILISRKKWSIWIILMIMEDKIIRALLTISNRRGKGSKRACQKSLTMSLLKTKELHRKMMQRKNRKKIRKMRSKRKRRLLLSQLIPLNNKRSSTNSYSNTAL